MGIHDVPATELIEAVAADLKQQVKQPEWIDFVKTGRHRERAPQRRDWFHVRMASILYRIYNDGRVGTNRLRTYYGGRKSRGTAPHKFFKASGKVIRVCLQELEKLGYLEKEKKGRKVTGKGESYLNAKAKETGTVWKEAIAKEEEAEQARKDERKKIVEQNAKKAEEREKQRAAETADAQKPVEQRPVEKPAAEKVVEKPVEKKTEEKAQAKEVKAMEDKPVEKTAEPAEKGEEGKPKEEKAGEKQDSEKEEKK